MKNLFFYFFFLFNTNIYSQNINTSNIVEYYNLTNQGELFIVESKYKDAIKCYKKAFDIKFPFNYDIYNALMCAALIGDTKTAIEHSNLLLKRGIKKTFFEKRFFYILNDDKNWKKFIAETIINQHNDIIEKQPIQKKIENLYILDQKHRRNDILTRDSIGIIDSLLNREVNILFNTMGYPSEDKIKVQMRNDTTIDFSNSFEVVLLHQLKAGYKEMIYKYQMYVHQGFMHPLKFVHFATIIEGDSSLVYSFVHQDQVIFLQIGNEVYTCNENDMKSIDSNRKRIYLESIEDLKKKINYYYFKNKLFKLNISLAISQIEAPNIDIVKQNLSKYNLNLYKKLDNNFPYFK